MPSDSPRDNTAYVKQGIVQNIFRTVHEDKLTINFYTRDGERMVPAGSLVLNLPAGHGINPADKLQVTVEAANAR
jgi:hypothetical protein